MTMAYSKWKMCPREEDSYNVVPMMGLWPSHQVSSSSPSKRVKQMTLRSFLIFRIFRGCQAPRALPGGKEAVLGVCWSICMIQPQIQGHDVLSRHKPRSPPPSRVLFWRSCGTYWSFFSLCAQEELLGNSSVILYPSFIFPVGFSEPHQGFCFFSWDSYTLVWF